MNEEKQNIFDLLKKEFVSIIKDTFNEEIKKIIPLKQTDADEIGDIKMAMTITYLAKQSIYDLSSRNAIPHFKRGKRIYFKKSELLSWLQSGRKDNQTSASLKIK